MSKIKVGILGVTGYSGIELYRLLENHPHAEVSYAPVRSESGPLMFAASLYLRGYGAIVGDLSEFENCDVVFSALPHVESLKSILKLVENKKIHVIDLSGDLRLKDPVIYEFYYEHKHLKQELLEIAVYGLPELNRNKITESKLIANPGCYATAALLAMLPPAKENAIIGSPVVDAKSGISGAGKMPNPKNLFCEVNENIIPYSIGNHKHVPEIEQTLAEISDTDVNITFTPQLIPVDRGILCTSYIDLNDKFSSESDLLQFYADFYKDDPFVRVLDKGEYPNIKSVRGSNRCDIGIHKNKNTGKTVIFSTIDNLIKGAAGQAIQNMNLMFGFEETAGLPLHGLLP